MRRQKITSLVCAAMAALAIGAAPASADPTPSTPSSLQFAVVCPGMEPFDATVVGAVGFVQGQRLLAVAQHPGQGSLNLVECIASNSIIGTQTVYLQFVRRG